MTVQAREYARTRPSRYKEAKVMAAEAAAAAAAAAATTEMAAKAVRLEL